jgi:hypothetical protein
MTGDYEVLIRISSLPNGSGFLGVSSRPASLEPRLFPVGPVPVQLEENLVPFAPPEDDALVQLWTRRQQERFVVSVQHSVDVFVAVE